MRTSEDGPGWCLLTKRVIEDFESGEPYLVRWTLLETPWFSIKLHRILLTDSGRILHDHPWPFISIILRGWYVEEAYRAGAGTPTTLRSVRWLSVKRATDFHRIVRLPLGGALTLFITGRKFREWGFLAPSGWTRWDKWIAERRAAGFTQAGKEGTP